MQTTANSPASSSTVPLTTTPSPALPARPSTANAVQSDDNCNTVLTDLNIRLYLHNVGGIRSQLAAVRSAVITCDYDIIILIETWFNDTVQSSELFDTQEWVVFRRDRCDTGDSREGGGVLIAIRLRLCPSALDISDEADLEHVWAKIATAYGTIFIGSIYLPPNSTDVVYDAVQRHASRICDQAGDSDLVFLLGDFNRPVEWTKDSENPLLLRPVSCAEDDAKFFDDLAASGLSQVCDVRARTQLELIFTTADSDLELGHASHPLKRDSYHHVSIEMSITLRRCMDEDDDDNLPAVPSYDFNRADLVALSSALSTIDWDSLFQGCSVDDMVKHLYDRLSSLFERHIPKRKAKRVYSQPWMTAETARLRNRRNRSFKAYKRSGTPAALDRFLWLRTEYLKHCELAYQAYLNAQAHLLKSSPRSFWRIVNEKRGTNGIPRKMHHNGHESSNTRRSAGLFADYFESNYAPRSDQHYSSHGPFEEVITDTFISVDEVNLALRTLDPYKAVGPDGIPNSILRSLADVMTMPLWHIFAASLKSGTFPEQWKSSFVTPIFKSGDRSQCSNYRGIALLSTMAKVFEQIVCRKLEEAVGHKISSAQHGFRAARSTTTNLVSMVEYLLNVLPGAGQVDAVYVDMAKAFDRVNHSILLDKVKSFGIGGILHRWLESYLTGRYQSVKMGSQSSRSFPVSSGVPQGSHLGPLLFCIFVDDLCAEFPDCLYLMYADDLKLFRKIEAAHDTDILQANLDRLQQWCVSNKMSLSTHKCSTITFSRRSSSNILRGSYTINSEPLERVSVINDLGVLLDERLTFKAHIHQVVQRSKAIWAFVRRQAKEHNCPFVAKALFCALVRSKLEYCSVVWSPVFECDKARIESVQKQFMLFALRHLNWSDPFVLPPYEARLSLLDLDSLDERRTMAAYQLATALLTNSSAISVNPPSIGLIVGRTRFLAIPRMRPLPPGRTRYEENSPLRRSIAAFNLFASCHNDTTTPQSLKSRLRSAIADARRIRLSARGF